MRLAAKTVLDKLQEDSTILPDNITVDAVYALLNFSLDNYFQYQDKFYKQTTGGPMGSPFTVALAEIRVTETKQLALETSSPPNITRRPLRGRRIWTLYGQTTR